MNIKIINYLFGENFIPILKYANFLVIHKKDVFCAGIHTGANIIDLIRHDFGKFKWKQIRNYARQYFGSRKWQDRYHKSRLLHRTKNRHHIQSHIENGTEISPRDAAHIAADWFAMAKLKYGNFPFKCCDAAKKWEEEMKNFLQGHEVKYLSTESRKNLLDAFNRPFERKTNVDFCVQIIREFDIQTCKLHITDKNLWN